MAEHLCDHQLVDALELCDFGGQCLQLDDRGRFFGDPRNCCFFDPLTMDSPFVYAPNIPECLK